VEKGGEISEEQDDSSAKSRQKGWNHGVLWQAFTLTVMSNEHELRFALVTLAD
jgi:hypothetical protein